MSVPTNASIEYSVPIYHRLILLPTLPFIYMEMVKTANIARGGKGRGGGERRRGEKGGTTSKERERERERGER